MNISNTSLLKLQFSITSIQNSLYIYTPMPQGLRIICQFHNGNLHPIAFWSWKLTPAECNYDIHDLEMLAIISAFQHWRHYLESIKHTIIIYTNHKNLEVFMIIKVLNHHQAHWIELLIEYDFVFTFISESKNLINDFSQYPDYFKNIMIFNE